MAETFKLPCSSYEELIKLFQAYANTKEGTALSLDEITQATGVPRTVASKNNGFMVQVGLITEGNKKAATETGRALGRAYTSKITDEVERIWKEIIAEVDFLNRMLSAVRIRNGMDRSSFINHIIYSSGLKDAMLQLLPLLWMLLHPLVCGSGSFRVHRVYPAPIRLKLFIRLGILEGHELTTLSAFTKSLHFPTFRFCDFSLSNSRRTISPG